ncbi:hypothetical protein HPB49_009404 [Dermacentor silvarum]|uniref:Uncharacterized protein n=1 Tax=Dermacentor silvarum TaxID=543639 RepID=A0ACB8CQK7_DERSI|nr:hypothetical protein HPB49_009404 [Dermacentor silvarum]
MERQTTNMREAVPVDKRVAVALYKLCSSAEDRTIAHLFDMGRSTVNIIYREFCELWWLRWQLEMPEWVKKVTGNDMENRIGFHQILARHNVILLALVDHYYVFPYTDVGSPGRCHDAHVYHQSGLSRLLAEHTFRQPTTLIRGVAVPQLILCDQAFLLTPNLIKSFASTSSSEEQNHFNYVQLKSCRTVENVFGRLKACFRFVMKGMESDIGNVPVIIRVCCVLNNIGEHFGDAASWQWIGEAQLYDTIFQHPTHTTDALIATGRNIRAAVAMHFHQQMDH